MLNRFWERSSPGQTYGAPAQGGGDTAFAREEWGEDGSRDHAWDPSSSAEAFPRGFPTRKPSLAQKAHRCSPSSEPLGTFLCHFTTPRFP